jgi:hypothetical protein
MNDAQKTKQSLAPENTTEKTQITKNWKLHYNNNIIFQKVAAILYYL